MGEGGKIWDGIYMRRFGMGFIYGGSNFVSVQPGWSYLEKREAEWSYLPFCFAGCALVFLHLTLPRGHTDRFSGDYGARPGNFHWRTGWNRWKSTMLSNNWRIIKEWIFSSHLRSFQPRNISIIFKLFCYLNLMIINMFIINFIYTNLIFYLLSK